MQEKEQEKLVKEQQDELVFSGQESGRVSLATSDYSSCSSSRRQQESAAPALTDRQLLEGRETCSQTGRQQKTAASGLSQAGRQQEPPVLSQAEKQLLELEETVIPLEMEAARVIRTVRYWMK